MINAKTKILGVFGYPVEHSLSPAMHNAAIKKLGLNCVYLPFSVKPEELGKAVESIRALNFIGVNVTIPHKQNVMKYIDFISPDAKKIGAVNTIFNKNGKLYGYNTDFTGFLKSIKGEYTIKGKTAFILGCGGASKAIAYALLKAGAEKITAADIDKEKLQEIKALSPKISGVNMEETIKHIPSSDILVNATPIGMKEGDASPFYKTLLNKKMFVFDVVYNRKTQLMRDAEKVGAKHINGLDMLLYQGAESLRIWTGKNPDTKLMKKMLEEALKC